MGFLNKGYQRAGYERFCGCDNPRSLLKNANLIKIVFYNNEWVAISIYTGYLDGFKNVGITATCDESSRTQGVKAVHDIIKTDIGNFKEFYWTECSGMVERLYEKYNGIKIPNVYASSILDKEVSTNGEDDFHYQRKIKGIMQRKIIYGFNNKDTFDKVLSEHADYINKCINTILSKKIDESIETPSFGKLSKLDCAIAIVNFFVDERWEGECYDFPIEGLKVLKEQINIIKFHLENGIIREDKVKKTKLALSNGIYILKTSNCLKLNKF